MHAEDAYLFRHALLRDAAYELQLPGDRARLHALALDLLLAMIGEAGDEALKPYADELADHARHARGDAESTAHVQQELKFTMLAAEHAYDRFDLDAAAQRWLRAIEHPQIGPRQLVAALRDYARVLRMLGRLTEARPLAQRALSMVDQESDKAIAGALLITLHNICRLAHDLPAAESAAKRALDLFTQADSQEGIAVALGSLGNLMLDQEQFRLAEPYYTKARRMFQEIGKPKGEAAALGGLGALHLQLNQREEAERHYLESAEIDRRLGNEYSLALTLCNLSELCSGARRDELRAEALRLAQRTANTRAAGIIHFFMARDAFAAGNTTDAMDFAQLATGMLAETENHYYLVQVSNLEAELALDREDVSAAFAMLETNAERARSLGSRVLEAETLSVRATAFTQSGAHSDADDSRAEAARLFESVGLHHLAESLAPSDDK